MEVSSDIPPRLREWRRFRSQRFQHSPDLIVTTMVSSRGVDAPSADQKPGRNYFSQSSQHHKPSNHCTVCTRPGDLGCIVCDDFAQDVFLTHANRRLVTIKMFSSWVSLLAEQNAWWNLKKGTRFQLDAGRGTATTLATQQVKPRFVGESLTTTLVKDALTRNL